MASVTSSLLLALGQLGERRVLWILAKSLAVTLVLVAVIAWGGWYLLDWGLDRAGLDEGLFEGAGWLRQAARRLVENCSFSGRSRAFAAACG